VASTYFHLKKTGFPCEVATEMPEEGIVVADRDTLGDTREYLGKVMLICTKSDREFHPSAHVHVVHNLSDPRDKRNALWNPYYIPHWPLPGLIPRDPDRDGTIENVGYIGTRSQLATELKSPGWSGALEALGCRWLPIFEPEKWNDFRSLDLIVAARTFGDQTFFNKGAIKLFNCWRAGVPAILAPESAFLAEKSSDLDFIPVTSLEEAIEAVRRLKNDPDLYRAMVARGRERGSHITTEATLEQWMAFFRDFAYPLHEKFRALPEIHRKTLFARRYLRLKSDRIVALARKLVGR
jgi:hypothetical protein